MRLLSHARSSSIKECRPCRTALPPQDRPRFKSVLSRMLKLFCLGILDKCFEGILLGRLRQIFGGYFARAV